MRRVVILSALLLTLVSCSDGASSPTAVAAPPPTPAPPPPPPPPPPPAVQIAGAWSGSFVAGEPVIEITLRSPVGDPLRCLEHRHLQPGTSRGIAANFTQLEAVLNGIVQSQGYLLFEFSSGQVSGSSFEFGSSRRYGYWGCTGSNGHVIYITGIRVRGVANVNGSPRDRLTGEMALTWTVDFADQVVGYVRQTHTLTLRR